MSKNPFSVVDLAEEDVATINAPRTADLSEITKIAKRLQSLVAEAVEVSNRLQFLSSLIKEIEEKELPDVMLECGMKSFTLEDGKKVDVKKFYSARIAAEHEEEAFNWLENNGHDAIIKNQISLDFNKGETERVDALINILRKMGYGFNHKLGVHHSTLRAFVKEQIEKGADLPMTVFGVYIGNRATIK